MSESNHQTRQTRQRYPHRLQTTIPADQCLFGSIEQELDDNPDSDSDSAYNYSHSHDQIVLSTVLEFGNLLFFGAFFQFTEADREAWNELIEYGDIPDPAYLLGASWTRTTGILPDERYENHMPVASHIAKGICTDSIKYPTKDEWPPHCA